MKIKNKIKITVNGKQMQVIPKFSIKTLIKKLKMPLNKIAIELNKNFSEAYKNLGNLFLDKKKYNEAIFNHKIALKIIEAFFMFSLKGFLAVSDGKSCAKLADILSSKPDFFPRMPLNRKKINPAIIAKSIISIYSKL